MYVWNVSDLDKDDKRDNGIRDMENEKKKKDWKDKLGNQA